VTSLESSAVLFDIDGTLVDSTYHHALAWQRAFDSREITIPFWRIHRTIGMGGDKLVAHVAGEDAETEHGDALRDVWREEYLKIKPEVRALPGATDLVKKLASGGFRVALASSGDPEFADETLDYLDIRDDIAVLKTSEDADGSKPEPDLIEVTLEELDVRHAVLVGDTPYDVQSAERAGLGCIAVRSGGYSEAELVEAGAVLVVDTTEDLLELDWEKYLAPVG
jgi:HAD superfamily hydrolase (TIGR01549 family)